MSEYERLLQEAPQPKEMHSGALSEQRSNNAKSDGLAKKPKRHPKSTTQGKVRPA